MNQNPLLNKFKTPFGSIPFDEIKLEHFLPAVEEAIKEAILEGEIPNDYQASYDYMLQKGEELGLKIV